MRRNRFHLSTAFGAALAFAAAAAFAAMSMAPAEEPMPEKHTKIRLKVDALSPDTIVMEDLHDLEVGESRSFTTESGKVVIATRTDAGFELDVDGKTIRLADFSGGGDAMVWHAQQGAEGDHKVITKRIEIAGDGESGDTMIWHSADGEGPQKIHVIRKVGGEEGAHGYAFSTGEGVMVGPFSAEGWIQRLEKTESFQQLDEASRELVRQAMREAAKVPVTGEGVFLIDVEETTE